MPSLFLHSIYGHIYVMSIVVRFESQRWYESQKRALVLSVKRKKSKNFRWRESDVCIFTLAYFNKKVWTWTKVWSGSHPLCRTSSTKQQGFIQQVFTPLADADGVKKFYYYILLLCGCFEIDLSPCLCRWCVKQYRKVVRSNWSSEHSPWPGQASLSLSGY